MDTQIELNRKYRNNYFLKEGSMSGYMNNGEETERRDTTRSKGKRGQKQRSLVQMEKE